jgi:hypothetical protein
MAGSMGRRIKSVGAGRRLERMRRRFIFSGCERRNRSGVPPVPPGLNLPDPLPVNVSLLGAPGLRPGAPFLAFGVWPAPCRVRKGRMIPAALRPFQKRGGSLSARRFSVISRARSLGCVSPLPAGTSIRSVCGSISWPLFDGAGAARSLPSGDEVPGQRLSLGCFP